MKLLGKDLEKELLIVAEISCNHNGSIKEAFNLIEEAKKAGASAVKFQAYTPDELTINHKSKDFLIKEGPWRGKYLWDLYSETYTPLEWIPELFYCAKSLDIPIFASVFGGESLKALEKANCPAYKIASFEANDINLLKLVWDTGKPNIISLGCVKYNKFIPYTYHKKCNIAAFMHCCSEYPAKLSSLNMEAIRYILDDGETAGFSDHTLTSLASQIAIAMGATVIEKHFTLSAKTQDAKFSLYPDEFAQFVLDCNKAKLTVKNNNLERPGRYLSRSLYVVKNIKTGEKFTKDNVRSIRPGYGLDPDLLETILGSFSSHNIKAGTPLKKEHLGWL